ncbi:RNA-directed DNA polymerase, eukaryota, reverse transcriptase zinc-binding domain protein [Tanacetum coccineum]
MITQELLKGYNCKNGPSRCSFKIDIAKAYDTVDWNFLRKIRINFGFYEKMVGWIMLCVSTTAFTIGINGERYGYFRSGRGLRQGDLVSPYLFTLIMEVFSLMLARKVKECKKFKFHKGCKEMQLTHLSFADDLLVLCHGDEVTVNVIKDALLEFSHCSGLKPNMEKSVVFFGSVKEITKQKIIEILPFKVGKLPVRYLGIPLLAEKLSIKDCNHLVEKVKSKIQDWKNRFLSYAGKLQLIADVDPKFLGMMSANQKRRVVWVNLVKLKGKSFWVIEEEPGDSGTWKALLDLRNKIRPYIIHKVGNGKRISMWNDNWSNHGFLKQFVTDRDIHDARISENCCVADLIENGKWCDFSAKIWDVLKYKMNMLPIPDKWTDIVNKVIEYRISIGRMPKRYQGLIMNCKRVANHVGYKFGNEQMMKACFQDELDNVVEEEDGEWICFLGSNNSSGTKKYQGSNSSDGGNTGDGVKIAGGVIGCGDGIVAQRTLMARKRNVVIVKVLTFLTLGGQGNLRIKVRTGGGDVERLGSELERLWCKVEVCGGLESVLCVAAEMSQQGEVVSSGWYFVYAILGPMTYSVTSSTLDSTGSYVMQGAPFTQGMIPSIPIGGSISPEGFLPSILLLVVIIVTVVVVDDVSLILKILFVIIGFLHRIMLYYLIH